jgi:hypothetical protein
MAVTSRLRLGYADLDWRFGAPLVFLVAGVGVVAVTVLLGWMAPAGVLGVAVAVPLAVALRKRPQYGVLALVALVPFDGLLLIIPHPEIAKSWKEGLVLATLAATFLAPPQARGPRGRRLPPLLTAVALLVLLGAVSAVWVRGQQGLTGFRIDFFYLLLAWAVWRCPIDAIERDRLVTILMTTGVVTALGGIAQQVVGASRLHALGYPYDSTIRTVGSGYYLRAFSSFNDPFSFAFFLMVVLLVCVPVALSDLQRRRNRLFLCALPIVGLGLMLTFVRGALLGLAVGWAYLGLKRYRVLLVAFPFAVLALFYLPGGVTATVLSGTTLAERGSGWQANLHQVVTHPLGVGIGSTGAAAQKVATLQPGPSGLVAGNQAYTPDNYYFQTVYELGVLGLWLFVVVLVSAFGAARTVAARARGPDAAFALGVTAMVAGAAAASTVAAYFAFFPIDVLSWLLLGVVVTLGASIDRRPSGSPAASPEADRVSIAPVS